MIFVEYEQETKDEKLPSSQWIEIESKFLELINLRNNI